LEQAHAALEAQLLRAPTDAELAAELDVTEDELAETLRQMSLVGVAALDEVFMVGGDRSERTTLGDTIPDSTAGPVAVFEDKESKEILAKAISQLGDREKTVLSLYYYEGLTLAEIGEILGVTESRVCQIHTKAVLQLRTRLSDRRMDGTQILAHPPGHSRRSGIRSNASR
jgi:RNA polymerase sigma factor for flagellar operon FliA